MAQTVTVAAQGCFARTTGGHELIVVVEGLAAFDVRSQPEPEDADRLLSGPGYEPAKSQGPCRCRLHCRSRGLPIRRIQTSLRQAPSKTAAHPTHSRSSEETKLHARSEMTSSGHIWLKAPDPIPNSEVKQP